jgi:hypothetical protein
VGENAHCPRQDEDAPAELGLESQLAVHDGRDAVDVHRYGFALAPGQRGFDGASDAREASRDDSPVLGGVDELQQAGGARIERMEAMAEPGDDLLPGIAPRPEHDGRGAGGVGLVAHLGGDRVIELHALLPGAAMDIVERVDRGSHGAVDRQATSHRHPRDRDRRRLRAVVDRGDHRRLQQIGLCAGRQIAAEHQPHHLGEADGADQLLDRVAAHRDLAGMDVDDGGRPPGRCVGKDLLGGLARHAALLRQRREAGRRQPVRRNRRITS